MARWGLFVEENLGPSNARQWRVSILGEVEGTMAQALAGLWQQVLTFRPRNPTFVRRQCVYRQYDGFIAIYEGATSTFGCRFSVGELVRDTAMEEKGRR